MKRLITITSAVLICVAAAAQDYAVLETVSSDRLKLSGCEGPYRFDAPALTPAPKGYTPFYISHYGRHGSRYAWNPQTYVTVRNVLEAANRAGSLTDEGKSLYDSFMKFVDVPLLNAGDLSGLGWEQHGAIAEQMVKSFPEVFSSGGKVSARATTSQRVIVSGEGFLVSLQKNAPKVEIVANSLHTEMPVLNATSAPSELRVRYDGNVRAPESLDSFRERKIDYDGILDRLFSDRGFLEEIGGRTQFITELFTLWQGYHNYSDEEFLEDVFTPEQQLSLWEANNYELYLSHAGVRYQQIPLLVDIIVLADEAISSGEYKADLRFGHDTIVNSFGPLINVDGSGTQPSSADEVKYWFQTYKCPMAANFQFVFYKSKKNPEILFKLLRNGAEATLPQIQPVEGPYYSWNAFKEWAEGLIAEHPRMAAAPQPGSAPRR